MELGLNLENFPDCKELLIPSVTTGPQYHKVKMRLYDTKKRLLELLIKIIFRKGGSVKVSFTFKVKVLVIDRIEHSLAFHFKFENNELWRKRSILL